MWTKRLYFSVPCLQKPLHKKIEKCGVGKASKERVIILFSARTVGEKEKLLVTVTVENNIR
jgi:hypothetical protein